jgi:hypothetical protein
MQDEFVYLKREQCKDLFLPWWWSSSLPTSSQVDISIQLLELSLCFLWLFHFLVIGMENCVGNGRKICFIGEMEEDSISGVIARRQSRTEVRSVSSTIFSCSMLEPSVEHIWSLWEDKMYRTGTEFFICCISNLKFLRYSHQMYEIKCIINTISNSAVLWFFCIVLWKGLNGLVLKHFAFGSKFQTLLSQIVSVHVYFMPSFGEDW